MSTHAERKARTLRELAALEQQLVAAGPGELPWEFRNRVLETVEKLPHDVQERWKTQHMRQLREATKNHQGQPGKDPAMSPQPILRTGPGTVIEFPVLLPAWLAHKLANKCGTRRIGVDGGIAEAIRQWCGEGDDGQH